MYRVLSCMNDESFTQSVIDSVTTEPNFSPEPSISHPLIVNVRERKAHEDIELDAILMPLFQGSDDRNKDEALDEALGEALLEEILDEAFSLLSGCLYDSKRSYEAVERALVLIKQIRKSVTRLRYKLVDLDLYCRAFVYFPDLLKEFLDIQREAGSFLNDDDLGSMFCRCIENKRSQTPLNSINREIGTVWSGSWAYRSIQHLIEFKGCRQLEIKLLPGKYDIDPVLYDIARSHGIRDSYYDASLNKMHLAYKHQSVVSKEMSGFYTGFRDAYHVLLYGGVEDLQSLIMRWNLWGDDCTADAARDFFRLGKDCLIYSVIQRVNRKCKA